MGLFGKELVIKVWAGHGGHLRDDVVTWSCYHQRGYREGESIYQEPARRQPRIGGHLEQSSELSVMGDKA